MTGPILFEITAADSHQQIILPVIRRLRARGIPTVVASDCEVLRGRSDIAGLERDCVTFTQLTETPLPGPTREWEPAAAVLRAKIGPAIDRIHPALVAVLNDRNFPSNMYVAEARRRGIPTLLIQESLRKDLFQAPPLATRIARWRRRLRYGVEEGLRHYGQGGCDMIAAWGETSREYFHQVGVPDGRIVITGNPRFDQLANPDFRQQAETIRGELGLAPDDFLLCFLSSPIERMQIVSPAEKRVAFVRMLDWTVELRAKPSWKGLRLAFKLHRGENAAEFRQLLKDQKAEGFTAVTEQPLYPLLAASQAALMFSTTAGLEAALLRRPLGQLQFQKPLDDWDFAGRGVASRITDSAALNAFLTAARSDADAGERARQAATAYVDHVGHAAENVVDQITKLINQKTSR